MSLYRVSVYYRFKVTDTASGIDNDTDTFFVEANNLEVSDKLKKVIKNNLELRHGVEVVYLELTITKALENFIKWEEY